MSRKFTIGPKEISKISDWIKNFENQNMSIIDFIQNQICSNNRKDNELIKKFYEIINYKKFLICICHQAKLPKLDLIIGKFFGGFFIFIL